MDVVDETGVVVALVVEFEYNTELLDVELKLEIDAEDEFELAVVATIKADEVVE